MSIDTNDYLTKVRQDRFKGFGQAGVLSAPDAPDPGAAPITTSKSNALRAKFFGGAQSVTLTKDFLPKPDQVASTLQLFGKQRQTLLGWKETLAEEVEEANAGSSSVVGKKRGASSEGAMQQLMRSQFEDEHLKDFSSGGDIRTWRRWLTRNTAPNRKSRNPTTATTDGVDVVPHVVDAKRGSASSRLQPRLSIFLALDVSEMTALLHAVCQLLLGQGAPAAAPAGGGGGGSDDDDAEGEEEECEDDEDDEEDSDEEEQGFLPLDQREALALLGRLCGSSVAEGGLGDWVFAALVSADLPMEASTERLLQDVLKEVCKAVRSIGTARGVGKRDVPFWEEEGPPLDPAHISSFPRSYKHCGQVGKREFAALHTIMILIGRFFRQGDPKMLPL